MVRGLGSVHFVGGGGSAQRFLESDALFLKWSQFVLAKTCSIQLRSTAAWWA